MPADASLLLLLLILGAVSLLVGLQVWQIIRSRRPGSRPAPENEYHVTAPVLELRRSPGRIPEEYWRWDSLTLREREIVRLAVVGKQNSEIARELSLSPATVATHLKNIYRKLQIHSRRELANFIEYIDPSNDAGTLQK